MKTILIAILSVAAVYGAAVAVNDTAKAGIIVPSLRVEAETAPASVEPVNTMLTAARTKHTATHSATARSQSTKQSTQYVCRVTALASDVSAQVRRCEWL